MIGAEASLLQTAMLLNFVQFHSCVGFSPLSLFNKKIRKLVKLALGEEPLEVIILWVSLMGTRVRICELWEDLKPDGPEYACNPVVETAYFKPLLLAPVLLTCNI